MCLGAKLEARYKIFVHTDKKIINLLTALRKENLRTNKRSEEIYYNKLFVINELRYLFHSVFWSTTAGMGDYNKLEIINGKTQQTVKSWES